MNVTTRALAATRRATRPRRERDVQAAILQWLQLRRGFFWRNNTGALRDKTGRLVRYGVPGMPDILGVLHGGRMVAIECKRPGEEPTRLQSAMHEQLRGCGALVIVAYSLDDVLAALR